MHEAVVIGAGPAGLASAGALRRRGVPAVVLDSADVVASSWQERYDGLRLNTPRFLSHLPGAPLPWRLGRWVRWEDFLAYLEHYARANVPDLRLGVSVERISRQGEAWTLDTSEGRFTTRAVVVATGFDRVPKIPDWPGRAGFSGTLLHSADYREPSGFLDKDVLVVGAGTSGNEIAVQVLEGGAARVRVAIRRRQTIAPRELRRIPPGALAYPRPRPPAAVLDAAGRAMERAAWGDLRQLGFSPPPEGMGTMLKRRGHGVAVDSGLIAAVRAERIEIVPAVEAFEGAAVVLAGGRRISPDVVIAATGYGCGLEPLVGHLPGALQPDGRPAVIGKEQARGLPGLHFVGYRLPPSGQIPELRRDAGAMARAVARAGVRRDPAARRPRRPDRRRCRRRWAGGARV